MVSVKNATISLLGAAQSAIWRMLSIAPEWGVYVSNSSDLAVVVDSVVAMAQRKSAQISDYPVETGSFASYNKVERPREVPITLSKGGSENERTIFLGWLQTNVKAPTLFDVVMPEQRFTSMTLVDYIVRREPDSGATIIFADCIFAEIRQTSFQYYKSTQSDNDTPSTPAQKVQPVAQ
jgi:hypothetical protein